MIFLIIPQPRFTTLTRREAHLLPCAGRSRNLLMFSSPTTRREQKGYIPATLLPCTVDLGRRILCRTRPVSTSTTDPAVAAEAPEVHPTTRRARRRRMACRHVFSDEASVSVVGLLGAGAMPSFAAQNPAHKTDVRSMKGHHFGCC